MSSHKFRMTFTVFVMLQRVEAIEKCYLSAINSWVCNYSLIDCEFHNVCTLVRYPCLQEHNRWTDHHSHELQLLFHALLPQNPRIARYCFPRPCSLQLPWSLKAEPCTSSCEGFHIRHSGRPRERLRNHRRAKTLTVSACYSQFICSFSYKYKKKKKKSPQ